MSYNAKYEIDRALHLVGEVHSTIYNPDDRRSPELMLSELESILRLLRNPPQED